MTRQIVRNIGTFTWFVTVLVGAFIAVGIAMPAHEVSAGSCGPGGIGWFSGNDYSCDAYGVGGHDVDPGQFSSADTSKGTFINDVESSPDAKFYVTLITGDSHSGRPSGSEWTQDKQDFEDAVNNPDIGITVDNPSTRNNSMQIDGDYVFYQMSGSISPSTLILYSKSHPSTQYTEIKIDCGNPLNSTPLPKPNKPTGSFTSITCSGGNYTISAKWDDKDAPADNGANAYITAAGGKKQQTTKTANSGTGTWTVSTLTFTSSDWPIELYVQDYPGSTYDKVDTGDQPSCGGPSGTLKAACTASGVSYSGSFYDPNGATTAKVTGGGFSDSYTSVRSNRSASTAKSISHSNSTHPTGSITLTLTVVDSRGGKKPPYTVSASATCPPPTILTGLCPNNPTLNANQNVIIALADATPYGSGPNAPTSTTSPGSTYTQNVSEKRTRIDSVTTSLPNPSGLSPGSLLTNAVVGGEASPYNQAKFDWTKYMATYPYDDNDATVNFTSYYKQSIYRAHSHVDFYSCPSGGSLSGTTCYPGYGATDNQVCTGSGSSYKCTDNYSCPYGGSLSGSYCNLPAYGAQANYNYDLVSGPTEKLATGSGSYTQDPACYYRDFNVSSSNGVQAHATLSPTQEDPTTATGNATATVTFSISHGGAIRKPYLVNGLVYASEMYGQNGMECSADSGGTFNVPGPSGGSGVTASYALPSITCNVEPIPNLGSIACAEYDVSPTGDKIDQNGAITLSNGLKAVGIGCSLPVENQPYLKVFGGDAAAGVNFTSAGSCTSTPAAQILTWNQGPSGNFNGAGTELAALALGSIDQFASTQGSTNPSPGSGLSFANTTGAYGGSLGGNPGCSADYYDAASGSNLGSTVNLSTLPSGNYQAVGDITSLSGTVPAGTHITIYSTHNVLITGPVAYGAGATKVEDLPAFTLVVKGGTIAVVNSVGNLSGNYIAQGGTINDCVQPSGATFTSSTIFANCGTKLTVTGSFLGKSLLFYRMGNQGSLRYSDSDNRTGNHASEEFDYTPVSWLAQPPNDGKLPPYDAITSLPPVL